MTELGRSSSRKVDVAATLLVAMLALGLRWQHRADTSPWEDECFRIDLALGSMAHQAAARGAPDEMFEHHPPPPVAPASLGTTLVMLRDHSPYGPLFPSVMHGLMAAGVTQPSSLVGFNALCGAVTAALLFLIARRGCSVGGSTSAAVLFALSPWDVGVGMQFKETALATTLGLAAAALLLEALARGQWRWWLAYGVCLGAAFLVQNQAVSLVPLHGVLALLAGRPRRATLLKLGSAWLVAGLTYLPWFAWAGRQQLEHIRAGRAQGGTWGGLAEWPMRLQAYLGDALAPAGPSWLRSGPLLAALGSTLFLLLALRLWRRAPSVSPSAWTPLDVAAAGAVLWLGGTAMAAAVYLGAHQNQALWPRYMPPAQVGLWLALGGVLDWASGRLAGALEAKQGLARLLSAGPVAAALGLALTVLPQPLQPLPFDRYSDWGLVRAALVGVAHEGDLVLHAPGGGAFDAFIHGWLLATRHLMVSEASLPQRQRVLELAGGRPVWLVTSWGEGGAIAGWDEVFQGAGWSRFDVMPLRDPQPERPGAMPAGIAASTLVVQVVGYTPPAPPTGAR